MPNWKFLAQTDPEIWREFKNFKSSSRDAFPTPFDLIFHFFFSLLPPVFNLRAKFKVSSSNRSRDMEGVTKYQK